MNIQNEIRFDRKLCGVCKWTIDQFCALPQTVLVVFCAIWHRGQCTLQYSTGSSSGHGSSNNFDDSQQTSGKHSDSNNLDDSRGRGGSSNNFDDSSSSSSSNEDSGSSRVHRVNAAVQTRHQVHYVTVDLPKQDLQPQIIEIEDNSVPIILNFKSSSSRIHVKQSHSSSDSSGSQEVIESKSEDKPQRLRHQVVKPIIQEVREIILPYRKIVQEVRPVIEEIQTVVARQTHRDHGSNGNGHNNRFDDSWGRRGHPSSGTVYRSNAHKSSDGYGKY